VCEDGIGWVCGFGVGMKVGGAYIAPPQVHSRLLRRIERWDQERKVGFELVRSLHRHTPLITDHSRSPGEIIPLLLIHPFDHLSQSIPDPKQSLSTRTPNRTTYEYSSPDRRDESKVCVRDGGITDDGCDDVTLDRSPGQVSRVGV
jgi:hypothetical protein